MGRKKRLHLGQKPIGGQAVKSRRVARKITSEYHLIQNERSQVVNSALPPDQQVLKLGLLDTRLESIGGTHAYQQASIVSTQHFRTSRWVTATLRGLGMGPGAGAGGGGGDGGGDGDGGERGGREEGGDGGERGGREEGGAVGSMGPDAPATTNTSKKSSSSSSSSSSPRARIPLLEIGAINTQLHAYPWLDVTSIDLNSQHPLILEQDFLTLSPAPGTAGGGVGGVGNGNVGNRDVITLSKASRRFEVLVCSMVINCVDTAARRGEMLARLSAHLPPKGLLLLVLPSRCLRSPHLGGLPMFLELLGGFGLTQAVDRKETPKLTFFVLRKGGGGGDSSSSTQVTQGQVVPGSGGAGGAGGGVAWGGATVPTAAEPQGPGPLQQGLFPGSP
ncbi:hypothetical protein B484DRAFT_101886 [Ochromonadaceae sp. CCMP2298]|nr:hypothetical protein B484DRAFT_101886 [Ochromonadaceae sp. CCMP2298]